MSSDTIGWSHDFVVLDTRTSVSEATRQLDDTTAAWVVFHDEDEETYFACATADSLGVLKSGAGIFGRSTRDDPVRVALKLDRASQSVAVTDLAALATAAIEPTMNYKRFGMLWRHRLPIAPYLLIEGAEPRAIGAPNMERPASRKPSETSGAEPATDESSQIDEGACPVRYPSIRTQDALVASATVTFKVDALLEPDETTDGAALDLKIDDADWQEHKLIVHLSSAYIDFENDGRGELVIRRNQSSIAATIAGTVDAGLPANTGIAVVAVFFDGARFCGSAQCVFSSSADAAVDAGGPDAPPQTRARSMLGVELGAQQPELTLYITQTTPGQLFWRLTLAQRIDGLPGKLSGTCEVGQTPEAEAKALFEKYARLEEGKHVETIEGFGSDLWERAPAFFKEAYWVLNDHYQRALTIQIITDEPLMPWELMRPVRKDESEVHEPLAFRHNVARWIESYEGYMANTLPGGEICTIAPDYKVVSRRLPRAVTESRGLVERFAARAIKPTRQAVLDLLHGPAADEQVALLHFAGHGEFEAGAASQSSIALEDGTLSASEVGRPETQLGRRCRTLVFFNACQVGSSGSLMGQVGGWASVFLNRRFGGFIAPLWSVEDQDAGTVAEELLQGIVNDRKPIGAILREIRAKHGNTSPTFYSYLYYGDVNAHFA